MHFWPFRRTSAALGIELAAHVPQLPRLTRQLQHTSMQIEQAITTICTTFQGMVARAQSTVADAEAVAGGHDDGRRGLLETLTGTRESFETLLGRLASAADRARTSADRVHGLEALAAGVEKGIAQVDAVAMTVRLLALNAKIEAARDGDRGAGFSVVAGEMERCAAESSALADQIRGTAKQLTSTLMEIGAVLRGEAEQASADMATSRRQIEGGLQGLQQAHESVRTQLAQTEHRSRALNDEIAAAVVALQFQDRVSQRLGHVVDALTAMHQDLATVQPAVPSLLAAKAAHRRAEVDRRIAAAYTMAEERGPAGTSARAVAAPASGEVELF